MKYILCFAFTLWSFSCVAQSDKIYLHVDKYSCFAGQNIWFKIYLEPDANMISHSNNVFIELLNHRGSVVKQNLYPVMNSEGFGQMKIPDTVASDNYYLRAFTKSQMNYGVKDFFSVPILIHNPAKPVIVFPRKKIQTSNAVIGIQVKDVFWISFINKDHLISSIDFSGGGNNRYRNFSVVKQVNVDSILYSKMVVEQNSLQHYSLFPIDTTKEVESLILMEDSNIIARQFLKIKTDSIAVTLNTNTLNLNADGYNSFDISIKDSSIQSASISITDADRTLPPPTSIYELRNSYSEKPAKRENDDTYITIKGQLVSASGKELEKKASEELILAGWKDSSYLFFTVVKMDSLHRFDLDSLFFFGDAQLQYQVNGANAKTSDIKLALENYVPPTIDSSYFETVWEDDSCRLSTVKLLVSNQNQNKNASIGPDSMKEVKIFTTKNKRKDLDRKYTTGAFSESAALSFDVRSEKSYQDLGTFLRAHVPGFTGGYSSSEKPVDIFGHSYLFFVNEENFTWQELQSMRWENIAYIKCLASDFIGNDPFTYWKNGIGNGFSLNKTSGGLAVPSAATPIIIAIYTKKDKDYRSVPSHVMKTVPIQGYTEIEEFKPDDITLYWNPMITENNFRVSFFNNGAKRFRMVIEGIDKQGKLIHFEKTIE